MHSDEYCVMDSSISTFNIQFRSHSNVQRNCNVHRCCETNGSFNNLIPHGTVWFFLIKVINTFAIWLLSFVMILNKQATDTGIIFMKDIFIGTLYNVHCTCSHCAYWQYFRLNCYDSNCMWNVKGDSWFIIAIENMHIFIWNSHSFAHTGSIDELGKKKHLNNRQILKRKDMEKRWRER